ncbi:mediator of RNA polymerase II transcription subunit 31 isoform X1 [Cygnus olor]|uniref:mediator of RNA polymerase II transcription subunit 31 isoform X1 n=1 Tax=Cygnus olor TaxID=8869 RepID=UPI001ADEB373|nr:mediator of RNA polymerase II transcription subunit 31 isoform X1 [Cygnus olor]
MRNPVIIRLKTTNDNYHMRSSFCHGGAARHESSAASDRPVLPARSPSADEAISCVRCPSTSPGILRGRGLPRRRAAGSGLPLQQPECLRRPVRARRAGASGPGAPLARSRPLTGGGGARSRRPRGGPCGQPHRPARCRATVTTFPRCPGDRPRWAPVRECLSPSCASAGRGPAGRHGDDTGNRLRFQLELEFVQCLANPNYLNFLAQRGYFKDKAFVNYLKYLLYWKEPEYAKYLKYPQCLHMLELLQYEHFRKELVNAQCAKFIDEQQILHWQHYSRKRMRLQQALAEQQQQNNTSVK